MMAESVVGLANLGMVRLEGFGVWRKRRAPWERDERWAAGRSLVQTAVAGAAAAALPQVAHRIMAGGTPPLGTITADRMATAHPPGSTPTLPQRWRTSGRLNHGGRQDGYTTAYFRRGTMDSRLKSAATPDYG